MAQRITKVKVVCFYKYMWNHMVLMFLYINCELWLRWIYGPKQSLLSLQL